jgi:hypothetical protein
MSSKSKIEKINSIIKTMNQLSPYMPPVMAGTEYLLLKGAVLYMSTPNRNELYEERLSSLLKEELSFIKEVKFIVQENKDND